MNWAIYTLIVGLFLTAIGTWQLVRARALKNRCTASVQGHIASVGRYKEINRNSNGRQTQSTRYKPHYEYQVSGQIISVTGTRGKGKGAYKEGETVEIRYNPDKPNEFVCAKDGNPYSGGILSIVLGLMTIVMTFV